MKTHLHLTNPTLFQRSQQRLQVVLGLVETNHCHKGLEEGWTQVRFQYVQIVRCHLLSFHLRLGKQQQPVKGNLKNLYQVLLLQLVSLYLLLHLTVSRHQSGKLTLFRLFVRFGRLLWLLVLHHHLDIAIAIALAVTVLIHHLPLRLVFILHLIVSRVFIILI